MKVDEIVQLYINEDFDIDEVFNKNPDKYVFRHTDCPLVFSTNGNEIFIMDMDEPGVDNVDKYGVLNLTYVYNDVNEFLKDFKRFEEVLGRELFISSWNRDDMITIREIELSVIKSKTK